jgi:hypothetical protein
MLYFGSSKYRAKRLEIIDKYPSIEPTSAGYQGGGGSSVVETVLGKSQQGPLVNDEPFTIIGIFVKALLPQNKLLFHCTFYNRFHSGLSNINVQHCVARCRNE